MPGSEVITTELLCHSLMWFATQMGARAHTQTQTQTKVRSRQTELTLKALCLRLLSLEALTAKENKQGQAPGVLVSVLRCALVSATCILAGWNNNPEARG